ncbi:GNAT superfamily N-acetyltransferase [Bacillus pakistanensis]|uniref:GNAT superfamily N-acetyltransferase n=1 Tax=Rossellomorea pakistanensis TaxID=992288 RepID=A0ABS2N7Q4_9BACI|nr:GNAT family N-acetyltransferase [Bacillus pakistanensis]MBM7583878.1 GNAT superfamily N-acetyltransferase [Bacillus pakistanensis]
MVITDLKNVNMDKLKRFFEDNWGSPEMILSTGVYNCIDLPGFVALEEYEIIGLITYFKHKDYWEIISLDAVVENIGIGTKLLNHLEEEAKSNNIKTIKLITTNDNIRALSFYQKRGYRMIDIIPFAVNNARKIKPEIPFVSEDGIPIRDELLLEKTLS